MRSARLVEFRPQLAADIGRPNPARPHQLLDVDHRTRPAQLDRDDEPATGLPGVGWPARCVLVHVSDRVLRNLIAQLRGLQVQPHRMIVVDRHGFSTLLNHAHLGLVERIADGGRFLGICEREQVIDRPAPAVFLHQAEVVHRLGVVHGGSALEYRPTCELCVVEETHAFARRAGRECLRPQTKSVEI